MAKHFLNFLTVQSKFSTSFSIGTTLLGYNTTQCRSCYECGSERDRLVASLRFPVVGELSGPINPTAF
jgi:hypothetical protein